MTELETELYQILKVMVETYESLRNYRSYINIIFTPQEQLMFYRCEQLYPKARELIERIEKDNGKTS